MSTPRRPRGRPPSGRPARKPINFKVHDVDRARWTSALRPGEALAAYLRAGADALALARAPGGPAPDVEAAVELVVRHLSERGHEALAHAVAVASDPDPPSQADVYRIGQLVSRMLGHD